MRMERIPPRFSRSQFVIVRLFRRWCAARQLEGNGAATMVTLAKELGEEPMLALALHSLLQLTEFHLGRSLKPEPACGQSLSSDEEALLLMIAAAPAPGEPLATCDIPHGLPGALSWAATSLKSLAGAAWDDAHRPVARCPFAG